MTRRTTCVAALVLLLGVAEVDANSSVVIDFESFDLGGESFLDVGSPLHFANVGGSGVNVDIIEGADNRIYDLFLFAVYPSVTGQALIDWFWPAGSNPNGTTILFDKPVSNFSLQAGDWGADDDEWLTIAAMDANGNVIGSDSVSWPASAYPPFATLSVNVSGIRKIQYQSGGSYANSTFIDNVTFIPEPSTLVLLGIFAIGVLAGWRRYGCR